MWRLNQRKWISKFCCWSCASPSPQSKVNIIKTNALLKKIIRYNAVNILNYYSNKSDLLSFLSNVLFKCLQISGFIPPCCIATAPIRGRLLRRVDKFMIQKMNGRCDINALVWVLTLIWFIAYTVIHFGVEVLNLKPLISGCTLMGRDIAHQWSKRNFFKN